MRNMSQKSDNEEKTMEQEGLDTMHKAKIGNWMKKKGTHK